MNTTKDLNQPQGVMEPKHPKIDDDLRLEIHQALRLAFQTRGHEGREAVIHEFWWRLDRS